MKASSLTISALIISLLLPFGTRPAAALSCLPLESYLKSTVGEEGTVIFEATSRARWEDSDQTVEILAVTKAHQGWVDDRLAAYHEKHPDWGYLCNNGPRGVGTIGLYVARRTDTNQYLVTQRLELSDPAIKVLKASLEERSVDGGVSPLTTQDRLNQIRTEINDLVVRIKNLLKEYEYWRTT